MRRVRDPAAGQHRHHQARQTGRRSRSPAPKRKRRLPSRVTTSASASGRSGSRGRRRRRAAARLAEFLEPGQRRRPQRRRVDAELLEQSGRQRDGRTARRAAIGPAPPSRSAVGGRSATGPSGATSGSSPRPRVSAPPGTVARAQSGPGCGRARPAARRRAARRERGACGSRCSGAAQPQPAGQDGRRSPGPRDRGPPSTAASRSPGPRPGRAPSSCRSGSPSTGVASLSSQLEVEVVQHGHGEQAAADGDVARSGRTVGAGIGAPRLTWTLLRLPRQSARRRRV